MTSQLLFQNTFILRKPIAAIVVDIINIVSILIKKSFKTQKK